jgi:hypothetical protein
MPTPIKWIGYALLILFFVGYCLAWASFGDIFVYVFIVAFGCLALVGGALGLWAMSIRIRTSIQEEKAAGHMRLVIPTAFEYAFVLIGGVILIYILGIFVPLATIYPQVQNPSVLQINQTLI